MPERMGQTYRMPAEWESHQRCWMAWPCRPESRLNGLDAARTAFAAVVRAIAPFELVSLLVRTEDFAEAQRLTLGAATLIEAELDDSWTRDIGLSHPWQINGVPALDSFKETLPEAPDCMFIHDVALLPEARRKGACHAYVDWIARIAHSLGLTKRALVSVYGTYPLWQSCGFRITPLSAASEKLAANGDSAHYRVADLAAFCGRR